MPLKKRCINLPFGLSIIVLFEGLELPEKNPDTESNHTLEVRVHNLQCALQSIIIILLLILAVQIVQILDNPDSLLYSWVMYLVVGIIVFFFLVAICNTWSIDNEYSGESSK